LSEDVDAGMDHFTATMGNVPAPIVTMVREAPEAFEGYIGMRTWLMRTPEDGGHLEKKINHLIFCLIDVNLGNLEGAVNHARAAVRNGLTMGELTEGVIQVLMTGGIATWGRTGYKLLDTIRQDIDNGSLNASEAAG
jgi:alkylhydroperoxidase/carboxymuconolactone decarboxylase family protein YurZ